MKIDGYIRCGTPDCDWPLRFREPASLHETRRDWPREQRSPQEDRRTVVQKKSEGDLALSEDSLDQTVRALLPNDEKHGPPCYLSFVLTAHPETTRCNRT